MMMMMRGGGGSSSSEVEVEPLLPRQQPPFTLPASLPPHPSITLPALPPTLITHPPTTSNTNHHNPNAQSSPMISPPNASSSSSSHLTLVSILAVFRPPHHYLPDPFLTEVQRRYYTNLPHLLFREIQAMHMEMFVKGNIAMIGLGRKTICL